MAMLIEQQKGESEKAFAAFQVYVGLGPERSLMRVAKQVGKSHQLIHRWSQQHGWRERIEAYAAQVTRLEGEAGAALVKAHAPTWAERQQEQREEEWRCRNELLAMAREALARWRAHPEQLESLQSIGKLLELASKLGRLATGLATERQELSGPDGLPIPLEISAALDKIYGPKPAVVTEPPPIDVAGTSSTSSPISFPKKQNDAQTPSTSQ